MLIIMGVVLILGGIWTLFNFRSEAVSHAAVQRRLARSLPWYRALPALTSVKAWRVLALLGGVVLIGIGAVFIGVGLGS